MTQAVAQCFGQAASIYDQHAHLQRRAAARLLRAAHAGGRWLDLGTGTGQVARSLPAEQVVALDLALPMLQQAQALGTPNVVGGDILSLPIQTASVDGIAANLSLQWCEPLSHTLQELARVARPAASLLATLPLAHTFPELRPLTAQGKLACNRFADLAELTHLLGNSPWREVRLQPFTEVVFFDSVRSLLAHFKATGAHHSEARQRGLRGRGWWHALNEQLSRHHSPQGYSLTWELVLVEATR